jgi:hypothetical protein
LALVFTKRADIILARLAVGGALVAVLGLAGTYYYAMPSYTRVGYAPTQPVPYSHAWHVGQLGMDCRYCHTNVEDSPHANVPATGTCMNCHSLVAAKSPLLAAVRSSWSDGDAVPWERVHRVPDYVYFNHSVHVRRGVGCVSCHGRVDEMPVVVHAKTLSMGWCLGCHRHPEEVLRPSEAITAMDWVPDKGRTQLALGEDLKAQGQVKPPQNCGACHR